MEASAGLVPGVLGGAEGAYFSGRAPGLVDACPEGHLDYCVSGDNGHNQEAHMSQGRNTDCNADLSDQEPEQLSPAKQDPADTQGQRRGRPKRLRNGFALWQVQELETVFQYTQYPDVFAR